MTFLNAIEEDDMFERDGWDYIERKCCYSQGNNLPLSFSGVSGGAIWAFELGPSKSTGQWGIGGYAFVGVTFYQTALENNERMLRGHFIRSTYDIAWRGVNF